MFYTIYYSIYCTDYNYFKIHMIMVHNLINYEYVARKSKIFLDIFKYTQLCIHMFINILGVYLFILLFYIYS